MNEGMPGDDTAPNKKDEAPEHLSEALNLLFGLALFAAGSSLAIVLVAMYQDSALIQAAPSGKFEFTGKDRLVTPAIVKAAAGFLFVTTASTLALVFKELLKPPQKVEFGCKRWLGVGTLVFGASAAALIGSRYLFTN